MSASDEPKRLRDEARAKIAVPSTNRDSISAAELQNMAFQEPRWVVPGLVPEGVTLFAGKPKVGKSWLALDVAIAVATGGEVLGIKCPQGPVIYAALEDGPARLRNRMDTLLGEEPWPEKLLFVRELPPLDLGGLDELRALCSARECRLVIVDVLARVRSTKKHGESLYDYDYRSLMPLANLARELGIAIVVVHHERKLAAIDRLDCVSGTTGLTAAADTILTLSRDNSRFMLAGRGRDLEEFEWPVGLKDGRWHPETDVHKLNPDQQRIVDLLVQTQKPMSPKEIAAALGCKEPWTRQNIKRLKDRDVIKKASYGQYTCHTETLANKPANPIG